MRMVDQEALAQTDSEDPGMIPELLEMFCESLPEILMRFDRAVEGSDAEAIRDSAHLMKSRLRYLHCYRLGDLAEKIEKQSRAGAFDGIEAKYAELKTGIAIAIEELREHAGSGTS